MGVLKLWQYMFALRLLLNTSQRQFTFRWLKSQQLNYLITQKLPWITFGAIDYLDGLDLMAKPIFEYGSGGSTLYWLKRGAKCVSIEHDITWFNQLSVLMNTNAQIDYRLVPPTYHPENPHYDAADPDDYSSDEYAQKYERYEAYVKQIDVFADNHFYIVLIDGRSRASCIKHAAKKVQIGGFLVLDNAERAYYTEKNDQNLSQFECNSFAGAMPCNAQFSETRIYRRNA
jgi:hypothetical protein